MNVNTLLSTVVLGAFLLNPVPSRADPDPPHGAVVATVPAHPNCLQATGSRIPQKAAECAGFGRSYSEQDLRQTGVISLGDALTRLDPAVTVGR